MERVEQLLDSGVVEILQFGFIGFAFLLAFLAYRLLLAEQRRPEPAPLVLDAITKYMRFALILGLMTIGSVALDKGMEEKPNPLVEKMLESTLNRTPMNREFVEKQIERLMAGHEARLKELTAQRIAVEQEVVSLNHTHMKREDYQDSLSRIKEYIREENQSFNSKLRDLKRL